MSAPGTPLDNAVAESFIKSLKDELVYPNKNKSLAEMKVLLLNYLSCYYPNQRIHTALHMTPYEFDRQFDVT
jgi:putative transposase